MRMSTLLGCLILVTFASTERSIGAAMGIAEAARQADLVVVAKIVDLGSREPGPPGAVYHDHAKATVIRDLSFGVTGDLVLSWTVQRFPARLAEKVPAVNESYVLFLREENDCLRVLKVLPATEDELRRIGAIGDQVAVGRARRAIGGKIALSRQYVGAPVVERRPGVVVVTFPNGRVILDGLTGAVREVQSGD
jgi:hypothetical protein